MKNIYIINIGRQLGSGGHEIGEKLSQLLNFNFYDKELINLASQKSGLDKAYFEKADESARFSYFDNFFSLEFSKNYLGGESLFKIQSDIIKELSKTNSCVFVGRCTDYILRNHPNAINIFISASEEDRINRTSERKNISKKSAKDIIDKVDKKRKEYYNFYTDKNWGKAESYDLCINSSTLGIDGTVNFILQFFKEKFKI